MAEERETLSNCAIDRWLSFENRSCLTFSVTLPEVAAAVRLAYTLLEMASTAQTTIKPPQK